MVLNEADVICHFAPGLREVLNHMQVNLDK